MESVVAKPTQGSLIIRGVVTDQEAFDLGNLLCCDGWYRSCVLPLATYLQSPEGTEPVNVQVLECHIDHGIQDVVVFADAVWMQSLRQHGVSILGDVPVLQLIKVKIPIHGAKPVEVLIGIEFELSAVRGCVL